MGGMHSGIRHNFWFWGINLVITIGKCATKSINFVGLPHAFASDVIALEEGMCMFMSRLFENGWDLVFIMWGWLDDMYVKCESMAQA